MSILQFPVTLPVRDEKGEEARGSLRLPGSLLVVDVYQTDPPGGEPHPAPAEEDGEGRDRKAA